MEIIHKGVRGLKANIHSVNCPTRLILDDLMSRWDSLALILLLERSYRFSELAYLIGDVSKNMLSQTLRRLPVNGLIRREMYAIKLPKVKYSLTSLGSELAKHMQSLLNFMHKNGWPVRLSYTKVSEV